MLLQKTIQMILVRILSLGLFKEIFIKKSQHNFTYPDKYFEVILNPTTTSLEFHSTKFKIKEKRKG